LKKFPLYFLAAALFMSPAFAMDLSLNKTVELIRRESQDLQKADMNVKKARAGLDSVNANRWFHISGNATYMNLINVENPNKPFGFEVPPSVAGMAAMSGVPTGALPAFVEFPDNIGMVGATINQPIYTFGKIGNAADAARTAIKMAESGKDIAGREVAYAAAQIYWTAKMTDGMVAIAKRNLDDSYAARAKLESVGRPNKSNLVKISADVASNEIALSDAEFNRDSAYRLLKVMAGIDENESVTLTDNFPDGFGGLNAPKKLESNPEWDMLSRQAEMYDAQRHAAHAGWYPTLAATASYNYIAMNNDYKLWNGTKNQSAYWGLSLSVPIFDGGLSRANATTAAMNAESARLDLDKSKKMKSNEYTNAVLKYDHLRNNFGNLKTARDLAARAAQISNDRFAAGQASAVELADVQSALAQMDMAVLNSKFNIVMARESIKKLNATAQGQ